MPGETGPIPRRLDLNDHRVRRFIEWLCTVRDERDPRTQTELATELGVSSQTLGNWKANPDFLAAWEYHYRKTSGSPEKQQAVLEALWSTAVDRTDPRQVPAARAFLEATDAIKPKKVDVTVTKATKDLSEEELNALLAEGAARELDARAGQ
jgi:hypothetical protein